MNEDNIINGRICPKCGREYAEQPAISRVDRDMKICPECGVREALEATFGSNKEEQDRILAAMHRGGKL